MMLRSLRFMHGEDQYCELCSRSRKPYAEMAFKARVESLMQALCMKGDYTPKSVASSQRLELHSAAPMGHRGAFGQFVPTSAAA